MFAERTCLLFELPANCTVNTASIAAFGMNERRFISKPLKAWRIFIFAVMDFTSPWELSRREIGEFWFIQFPVPTVEIQNFSDLITDFLWVPVWLHVVQISSENKAIFFLVVKLLLIYKRGKLEKVERKRHLLTSYYWARACTIKLWSTLFDQSECGLYRDYVIKLVGINLLQINLLSADTRGSTDFKHPSVPKSENSVTYSNDKVIHRTLMYFTIQQAPTWQTTWGPGNTRRSAALKLRFSHLKVKSKSYLFYQRTFCTMTCQPRISRTLRQREYGQSDSTLNPRLYHCNVTAKTFTASLPKSEIVLLTLW